MEFFKYHGTGNDFILLDAMARGPFLSAAEIREVCRRHTGIGADGVIFACPPAHGADAAMRIFNADGSEAEMCGNGIRCLAKFLYERLGLRREEMCIDTAAGSRRLSLSIEEGNVVKVEVDMGLPRTDASSLPPPDDPSRPGEVTIALDGGESLQAFCLSMGNPHCVIFTHEVAEAPLARLGPLIAEHELFPSRTNVEFAQVIDAHRLALRVWERGVGETMACGTGACAAAAAAVHAGRCDGRVEVRLPGGVLDIRVDEGGRIFMAAAAVEVFRGEVAETWLHAAGGAAPHEEGSAFAVGETHS